MAPRRILILGDSHTRALKRAVEERVAASGQQRAVEFDVHWLLVQKADKVRGELSIEDALQRVSSMPSDGVFAILLAGTLHNIFGLLQHDKPYDVFAPGDESLRLAAGASLIPENALWDMFVNVAKDNKRIQKIRKAATCAGYHLASPPPKRDNQYIMARAARYRDRLVEQVGVAPPELRLRLWRLEMRVVAQLCQQWGIGFLPAPQEAMDVDGFLKPDYYAEDATHANAAYGELVLRQLEGVQVQAASASRSESHV
jgi:hypothetical protein